MITLKMEIWTVKKLLDWVSGYFAEKGVDSARLSAELLLGHVLGLERIQLYTLFDRAVDPPKLAELRAMVKRAGEHEPVAYLVGRCEFYSLPLKITPDCLIPRPETEHLRSCSCGSVRAHSRCWICARGRGASPRRLRKTLALPRLLRQIFPMRR